MSLVIIIQIKGFEKSGSAKCMYKLHGGKYVSYEANLSHIKHVVKHTNGYNMVIIRESVDSM